MLPCVRLKREVFIGWYIYSFRKKHLIASRICVNNERLKMRRSDCGFSISFSDAHDWTILYPQPLVDVLAFVGGFCSSPLAFYSSYDHTVELKLMRKILPFLKERSLNVVAICVLCFSMSMGFFMEFCEGQVPCTLCFLQRICMMGTAFSLYLNLLYGVCKRYYGFALIWALLGLSVALRHIALNVCKPVPSDAFFFGPYRLYTWSFLVFFLSIFGIAALLCFNTKESDSSLCEKKGVVYFSTVLLLLMIGIGFYSVVSKQGWVF